MKQRAAGDDQIAQNLLEVKIGEEVYGFDGDRILQILRPMPLTPVPLSDPSLRGVLVINGKMVFVIDMAKNLALGEVDLKSERTRILTIVQDGVEYALLVDEVFGMVHVEAENYETISTQAQEKLVAFYKNNTHLSQVLQLSAIVSSLGVLQFSAQTIKKLNDPKAQQRVVEQQSQESGRYLLFHLAHERFAISLEVLRELIFMPAEITPMAESDASILGAIRLRGEVMVAFDARGVFGFSKVDASIANRLLILQDSGRSIALWVDGVDEVKDIALCDIERLPGAFMDKKIEGIFKEDDEITSIVSSLYIKELIQKNYIQEAKDSEIMTIKGESMSEMAVFRIGDEEFALDIEDVQEIIKYEEITPVPEAPQFVEGIINLRGVVVPIVSLPQRLGFEAQSGENSKILVCHTKDTKVGFLVDDVNEILFAKDCDITKSESEDALVAEVINLEEGKRVILKLNASRILQKDLLKQIEMKEKVTESV